MKHKAGVGSQVVGLLVIVVLVMVWFNSEPSDADRVAEAGGPKLGRMMDKRGRTALYKAAVADAKDFGGQIVVAICVPEIESAGKFFVFNGQPYGAVGFANTFAQRWGLTLEVDGVAKPIKEFDGAVGNILSHIEKLC